MGGHEATAHGGPGGHPHGQGPAMPGTKPGTDHQVDHHAAHPGARTYVEVAAILAVVTAIEVAIYYIEGVRDFLVPMLVILSIAKFIAVVGYFMHLKFDDRIFRWVFGAGMVISLSVVIVLVILTWTGGYFAPIIFPPE